MKKITALLTAALLMTGCASRKAIDQPPQGVQVQKIEAGSSSETAGPRFSALVTPDSQAQLGFRIPGYVISLMQVRGADGRYRDIAEGNRVSRGAVLVRIRAAEYQDKVRQATFQTEAAEAAALKAKLDFERATRLYADDSITKPDFDSAQAQYDATQADVRAAHAVTSEAQIAVHDTSLVAPFSGDIVSKSAELGSFASPGLPLFSVANTDTVKIIIGVPDTAVRSVKVGQPVAVEVDAFPNRTFNARISRISSAADQKTRNFDVEVAIANRDHLLKVGMIGSVQMAGGETEKHDASLLVPLSSVVQSADGKYGVFLLEHTSGGDIARLRAVEVGAVEGSDLQILSGVAAGDTVITTGAALVKDGARVEVLK
jgi:RND family efflux transporter MFP subunit